jgi:hypothetical protein
VEISVSMPLDEDGFLRRECPTCERQFKWFHGQAEDRPDEFVDPENYFCPYCGVPSGADTWWTAQQLEYVQAEAAGPLLRELTDELQRSLGPSSRHGFFSLSVEPGEAPEPPMPLLELNDLMIVAPPCHPFEPLKVLDDWAESLHCLMCGERFRL